MITNKRIINKISESEVIDKIQNFKEIARKFSGNFSIILNNEIFENSFKNGKRRLYFISIIKNLCNRF